MNAYELADVIADPHRATYPYHLDIADMLRQQADRIAELEKYEPNVKFENGVYKFDLPNGDEFVIVPKGAK